MILQTHTELKTISHKTLKCSKGIKDIPLSNINIMI